MRRLPAWFFVFFTVSGFCSLVYQVVWLRLTMAAFGVTTPMVSIVLSVFMGGLAVGSWGAGRIARRVGEAATMPLRLYALVELVVALSATVVPPALTLGRRLLAGALGAAWNSPAYFAGAGAWVTLCLLPFTLAMGATIPFAMWALRSEDAADAPRSFSHLYLANVLGALAGTLVSAYVLIELLGFRGTLEIAATLNALLAAAALGLTLGRSPAAAIARLDEDSGPPAPAPSGEIWIGAALFMTGFASLAMEVVWVRQFTPYLGTVVYAFATILAVYLSATALGSAAWRRWPTASLGRALGATSAWPIVATAGILPALAADPRWEAAGFIRVVVGVGPFCALLGFVTPSLVDRWSQGDPDVAGRAYAFNVAGSVLGPLVAGFLLLPAVAEPWALAALAVPLAGIAALAGWSAFRARLAVPAAAVGVILMAATATRTYETSITNARVLRDHTATVTASGEGMEKRLLVNGVGMTYLTPITKMMAHLPLAFHDAPARGLVLCFGMGTSFRSMHSWGVATTAVELIPSVPTLFGFFHADAATLLADPRSRVVVDDARRFLEWSPEAFDVIVVDPPPPVEAAGSSLLYSVEFYAAARRRLAAGGIVQQWIPRGDPVLISSMVKAISDSFPHVRYFRSVEGWGLHILASEKPLPALDAATLALRMPEAAKRDLVEWGPHPGAREMLAAVLDNEIPAERIVPGPQFPALRDEWPINEYFFLRRLRR